LIFFNAILSKTKGTAFSFVASKGLIPVVSLLDSEDSSTLVCELCVKLLFLLFNELCTDQSVQTEVLLKILHFLGLIPVLVTNTIFCRLSVSSLSDLGRLLLVLMHKDSSITQIFLVTFSSLATKFSLLDESRKSQMIPGILDCLDLLDFIACSDKTLLPSLRRSSIVSIVRQIILQFGSDNRVLSTCFGLILSLCQDELLRFEWKIIDFSKIDTSCDNAKQVLRILNQPFKPELYDRLKKILNSRHQKRIQGKSTITESSFEEMFVNQLICLK